MSAIDPPPNLHIKLFSKKEKQEEEKKKSYGVYPIP